MLIFTIRTDKPEAEISLYDAEKQLAHKTWYAHRQLAETIHKQIIDLLKSQDKDWDSIEGIVAYKGPGSFTGLRIGISVANALAYGLEAKIVGATDEEWQLTGISQLLKGANEGQVMPEYGAEAHITSPKR